MTSLEQLHLVEAEEWVIFASRPHGARLVPPVGLACLGTFLWLHYGLRSVPLILWVIAVAAMVFVARETMQSSYVITNRRVVLNRRVLRRLMDSLPLDQIAKIDVKEDGVGLGVKGGRILLTTTDGRRFALPWIRLPRTFRRLAFEQQTLFLEARNGLHATPDA